MVGYSVLYCCTWAAKALTKHATLWRWCPGPDLNRHGRNGRGILSPLCLPISPPGQSADLAGAKDTMQAENPKREPTK